MDISPPYLAFTCPCPSALFTCGALKGTVLFLAQGSLPFPYSCCSSAHQIYSTHIFQWDYKQSCVGFRLQPLVTPPRAEAWEMRIILVYIPASRAEVGPETRLRGWGPSYPGSWGWSGRRKKADAGDRGRPWWSTKQKLSMEFTSSCRIYRFCNKGVTLRGKTQYVLMTKPPPAVLKLAWRWRVPWNWDGSCSYDGVAGSGNSNSKDM